MDMVKLIADWNAFADQVNAGQKELDRMKEELLSLFRIIRRSLPSSYDKPDRVFVHGRVEWKVHKTFHFGERPTEVQISCVVKAGRFGGDPSFNLNEMPPPEYVKEVYVARGVLLEGLCDAFGIYDWLAFFALMAPKEVVAPTA